MGGARGVCVCGGVLILLACLWVLMLCKGVRMRLGVLLRNLSPPSTQRSLTSSLVSASVMQEKAKRSGRNPKQEGCVGYILLCTQEGRFILTFHGENWDRNYR